MKLIFVYPVVLKDEDALEVPLEVLLDRAALEGFDDLEALMAALADSAGGSGG